MIVETGILVGYLVAWGARKVRLVGQRLDGEFDTVMTTSLDKLHAAVAEKLGTDPALTKLEAEAGSGGQVAERTRQRVELSLEDAADADPKFAALVAELVATVQATEKSTGQTAAIGPHATAITGDVSITADHGSAAGWQIGTVNLGSPPPQDSTDPH